jgi:hypothetical protein
MATQMYSGNDPRAGLSTAKTGGATSVSGAPQPSSYGLFGEQPPQIDDASGRTWLVRGQNFVVAYTEAKPGAVLSRTGQVDEYVLLVEARDTPAIVRAGTEAEEIPGAHIVMVPPGDSTIELPNGGPVTRIFTTQSGDLTALVANAETYAHPDPSIPPFQPWPTPADGFRIRPYSLDVPPQEGRFGRIWRCTTIMVNVFDPAGPRDLEKLSPHHHDDFEQCSLALRGRYVHHLRWPWGGNSLLWRADEHEMCPAPSVAVIPARAIHTSAPLAPADNLLVDIFSPPRLDFSEMPDWVLNAADYPAPGPV